MASYQHLARYDDCSFNSRAKCTADIRDRQREALDRSRYQSRMIKLLKNRNLIDQFSANNHVDYDDGEEDYYYYDNGSHDGHYDTVDGLPQHNDGNSSNDYKWNIGWNSSSRSATSSPPLSHASDEYHHPSLIETQLYKILEPSSPRRRKNNVNRRQMLRTRKQLNFKNHDQKLVEQEYNVLKSQLLSNYGKDLVHGILHSRWNVLANAIEGSCSNLSTECLQFLANIVTNNLIEASSMTNILQQGLMISIKNALNCNPELQVNVIDVILSIIRKDSRAIPCLVEMLSHSQLLDTIEETMRMGTSTETKKALEFYQQLFTTLIPQLTNGIKQAPIVPPIVAQTNTLESILEMYSPAMSLKHLIHDQLIDSMITRFVIQGLLVGDEDLLLQAITLLMNCLWFCNLQVSQSKTHASWAKDMLSIYRSKSFESSLLRLINSDARVHTSVRSQLKEFLVFYQNTMIVTISPTW